MSVCPQRAECLKGQWWLLMYPGLKEVSTGVTVSAWHLVSVGFSNTQKIYFKITVAVS